MFSSILDCVNASGFGFDRAPVHLDMAGWGFSGKEERKEGCYDNFMMVFSKYVLSSLIEVGF